MSVSHLSSAYDIQKEQWVQFQMLSQKCVCVQEIVMITSQYMSRRILHEDYEFWSELYNNVKVLFQQIS